jgi:hypothetical protein
MSLRPLHVLATVTAMGLALVTLTRCEVLVNLDRGEVDGSDEQGCPICTEAGEDSGEDATSSDGGDAGPAAEAGSTDGGGDASPGNEGGEGSTTDSGAGG